LTSLKEREERKTGAIGIEILKIQTGIHSPRKNKRDRENKKEFRILE